MGGGARPARATAGAVALALLVAVAACGGPRYTYVKNTSYHTYFKLPRTWKLFDQDSILKARAVTGDQADKAKSGAWRVGFDGASKPSIDHLISELSTVDDPVGLAFVRTLSPEERDSFSLASLRAEVIGSDPLTADASQVEVVKFSDIERRGGFHGSEMVLTLKQADGTSATLHQIGLIDSRTHRVHVLAVVCRASCYSANKGVISQVISSWTVKER